ncbi:hypothetical protein BDZ89DRAFT_1061459 [Hymenopellis radicata]|nr:hypothetical protein BDZ89DRAFT_1061459 [Hymenopellis radicata]
MLSYEDLAPLAAAAAVRVATYPDVFQTTGSLRILRSEFAKAARLSPPSQGHRLSGPLSILLRYDFYIALVASRGTGARW